MRKRLFLLISSAIIGVVGFAEDHLITNYGAKADTTVLSTEFIQQAIDACHAEGGGRVVVPAGNFKTGSLFLKSNVYLYLSPGAVLYGSKDKRDYKPVKPAFLSLRTWEPTIQLIYGENLCNSGICGKGTIDGQGEVFVKRKEKDEGLERPHLIRFVTSKNITVEDVTLRNSGCWMQHYLACDDLQLVDLRIYNRVTKNNDALDLDGCHNVTVRGLICDSDDDAITLKSTSPRLCENISISNCVISSHCNGIKLGTETNGGFRNIVIADCVVKPSDVKEPRIFGFPEGISGISIEMVDGGVLDGVVVSNIMIRGTRSPIFIRLGNRARAYAEGVPVAGVGVLRNVQISNVMALDAGEIGCSITGIPGHPVENITLRNIMMEFAGNPGEYVKEPEEKEASYPEATMFGALPSYGFFVRHARNVKMEGVELRTKESDPRPAMLFDDVENMP